MPTPTASNARLSERAPFFAEVDVLSLDADATRRVWGTDVSEGGMFLQTTHPFRVGEKVSLRFDVPVDHDDGTQEHEVHIRAAEVRWVRPFEPVAVDGQLPGIGLRFLALDPPARAALRRFSRPDLREEITLPERDPVSMPSLPPPTTSLPPITGSIARHATRTPIQITEEMLAVSIPPFSTPPKRPTEEKASLPPDELLDMTFAKDALQKLRSRPPHVLAPRDVTMGPMSRPPSEPPHPLAGWTFARVVFEEETTRRDIPSLPPVSSPPVAVMPTPPVSAPPMPAVSNEMRFDSFDDERPALPSMIVEPTIMSIDSVPLGEARDFAAFERGEIAVTDLPRMEPRRARPNARTPSSLRALAFACALIVGGTVVGAGLGLAGKKLYLNAHRRPAAPVVAVATTASPPLAQPAPIIESTPSVTADTTIRDVADIEKGVPTVAMPAPPAAKPALVPLAPTARAATPEPARELPRKAPREPKEAQAFRLDIPVGDATVSRSFVLASPPRVVVDLAGGTSPKAPLDGDGTRTKRVRFGHPKAGTTRVVVELADGILATDVKAKVSGGRLALSFR